MTLSRIIPVNAKDTLEALLRKNREHERTSGPGVNNHVPMTLIALYRLGGSPEQMNRYAARFRLQPGLTESETDEISRADWQARLGHAGFLHYREFFDGWTNDAGLEVVLRDSLPVLTTGISTEAYHALLRLGYALDYGSREEAVSGLACWASSFYAGPDFDVQSAPAELEAFLLETVRKTASLEIEPVPSIDGRIRQVYVSEDLDKVWRPIRLPSSNPLETISEFVLGVFTRNQHFTLLHGITSCQALRLLLPYIGDHQRSLSQYCHSLCAAFVTVNRSGFEPGKGELPTQSLTWTEIVARAAAASDQEFEHAVKLTYSCWLEFQRSGKQEYQRLASREVQMASQWV
jgi:hypothetical protein